MKDFRKNMTMVGLILLPMIIIFFARSVVNGFSPSASTPRPIEVLREGAAYFSCEPPFTSALKMTEASRAEGACVMENGERYYKAVFKDPLKKNLSWNQWGFAVEFPTSYSQRFSGQPLLIEVTAACDGCSGPIDALYATARNAGTDWQDLTFGQSFSTQTLRYDMPPFADLSGLKRSRVVLNANKAGENAVLKIKSIIVRPDPNRRLDMTSDSDGDDSQSAEDPARD